MLDENKSLKALSVLYRDANAIVIAIEIGYQTNSMEFFPCNFSHEMGNRSKVLSITSLNTYFRWTRKQQLNENNQFKPIKMKLVLICC